VAGSGGVQRSELCHAGHPTEVDINPEKRADPVYRAKFYALLLAEFITVKVEGDHYHARGAGSPYPR
jgi:hypothetical protein